MRKMLIVLYLLFTVVIIHSGSISGSIAADSVELISCDLFLTRLPQNQPYAIIPVMVNEEYIIGNVPAGEYTLEIVPNSNLYPPQFYPGVPTPEEAEILILENNQAILEGIDFNLEELLPEDLGYLSGNVINEMFEPVSGLELYLYGIFSNYWNTYMAVTNDLGEFEIGEIVPGPYILFLEHLPGYQHYFWEDAQNFMEADPLIFESGSEITDINIQLQPADIFTVSGTVQELAEGLYFPLENALVSGYSQNCWGEGEYFQVLTDEYGHYSADISSGLYWLYSTKAEYTEQFWQNSPTFVNATPLVINEDIEDVNFVLEPLTDPANNSISGNITLDGEEPGYSCMVIVVASDEDDDWTDTTLSESSGYYYIDEIPAGDYYVLMLTSTTPPVYYPEGYDWENAEIVNIEGNVTNVDFAIEEFSQNGVLMVDGHVTEPDRSPVSGVSVVFFDENDMPFSFGISNDNGYYSAAAMETGSYSALASKTFYNSTLTNISIAGNSELDLEISHISLPADEEQIPQTTAQLKIYPNPFYNNNSRSGAQISFYPEVPGAYRISIFNLKGQLVKNIYSGWVSNRETIFSWDGFSNFGKSSTGIYLVTVSQGEETLNSEKILILK